MEFISDIPGEWSPDDFAQFRTELQSLLQRLDSRYAAGPWTPAGNNVTFTSALGAATRNGREFIAHFDVTWPVTADTSEARITGLPYTVANAGAAQGGFLSYTDLGSAVLFRGVANTTYGLLLNLSGATLTNADVSGKRFIGAVVSYID